MNPGLAFAATFVDQLAASGLTAVCVAPGSRSAPLAMAFARHRGIRVYMHVDERSCSFFAVGMAKQLGRPIAILCTSGTAAAEFHAAVIEAHHSRTPLLVLTADRPPELREAGANQAIDQARLYGGSVRWFFDPGPPELGVTAALGWRRLAARAVAECAGPPAGPVHLNLPFREPLTGDPGSIQEPLAASVVEVQSGELQPAAAEIATLRGQLGRARRPLLIAGEMRRGSELKALVAGLNLPVLAEPTSQLRLPGTIAGYDALLRVDDWAAAHAPDLVIRLGAPPTSKVLNQWLIRHPAPTILIDESGWRDPDLLASTIIRSRPGPLLEAAGGAQPEPGWSQEWIAGEEAVQAALDVELDGCELFEAHAVRALARALPTEANLMAGSSMPIRDLDTFWPVAPSGRRLLANRGASGIDGLVSTGLGMAAGSQLPSALLLGDLSLYHDMNGLWAIRRHGLKPVLVVLDNDGGGIFSFLPQAEHADVFEELFGTPLGLRLETIAELYGLEFRSLTTATDLEPALRTAFADQSRPWLIAARFSRDGSVRGHRACWKAVAAALR